MLSDLSANPMELSLLGVQGLPASSLLAPSHLLLCMYHLNDCQASVGALRRGVGGWAVEFVMGLMQGTECRKR